MRGVKTSRDGRYRMTYADQTLKKRTCVRIARYKEILILSYICLCKVTVIFIYYSSFKDPVHKL